MKLSQLYLDVITAIGYALAGRFVEKEFNMGCFSNCGTPSCALGHINVLAPEIARRFGLGEDFNWKGSVSTAYRSAYNDLFDWTLSKTIHTPQQWASHAIKWLAEQGVDYYEYVAGQQSCLSEPKGVAEPPPVPATPFERFMDTVMQPVEVTCHQES